MSSHGGSGAAGAHDDDCMIAADLTQYSSPLDSALTPTNTVQPPSAPTGNQKTASEAAMKPTASSTPGGNGGDCEQISQDKAAV
ncbi:hypothetical protein LSAT2_008017 [Lamellibrachia satsuma]|nr:hypothetical protein LSAT2_008017 [Lamellibrachia satsuma]